MYTTYSVWNTVLLVSRISLLYLLRYTVSADSFNTVDLVCTRRRDANSLITEYNNILYTVFIKLTTLSDYVGFNVLYSVTFRAVNSFNVTLAYTMFMTVLSTT